MRRPMSFVFSALLVTSAFGFAACSRAPEPVASLAVEPTEISLPYAASVPVELTWNMSEPLPDLQGSLRVLMHLLDSDGSVARTFDHEFPGGWQVGEERRYEVDLFQSLLGPALAGGAYDVTAGLYDAAGHRWDLTTTGEPADDGEYTVLSVAATDVADGTPEFYFSDTWVPIENGTDQQILARRWLNGEGAIRLTGLSGAGTLHLRVGVPTGTGTGQEMVLAEGAEGPVASIEATCWDFSMDLVGPGSYPVEIPLAPGEPMSEAAAAGPAEGAAGADPSDCEIRFTANYEVLSMENQDRRTVALENLAWSAGS